MKKILVFLRDMIQTLDSDYWKEILAFEKMVEDLPGIIGTVIKSINGIGCEKQNFFELSNSLNLTVGQVNTVYNIGINDLRRQLKNWKAIAV